MTFNLKKTAALLPTLIILAAPAIARAAQLPPLSDDALPPTDLTPQRLLWPGVVIIVVIALFITAAVTGPLIRANMQDPADSESP